MPGTPGHLTTVPTHRLPLTQAIRQRILRIPFPRALGGPFAAPLFAPISAPGTLCGCAGSFTSASLVSYGFTSLNYISVRLSRTFFRHRWNGLSFWRVCDKIEKISNWSLSHSLSHYVIPRRPERPTWESPVIRLLRAFDGGDCHVALSAPRNDGGCR